MLENLQMLNDFLPHIEDGIKHLLKFPDGNEKCSTYQVIKFINTRIGNQKSKVWFPGA